MVQCLLVGLSIILHQPFACGPRLSHPETEAALPGIVPIVVLQEQAGIDTLLYLSLDLICLLFWSLIDLRRIFGPNNSSFSLTSIWRSLSQEADGGSSPNGSR